HVPATTGPYTLSLHDALPIWREALVVVVMAGEDDVDTRTGQVVPQVGHERARPVRAGAPGGMVPVRERALRWMACEIGSQPSFQDRKSTRLNSSHVSISYAVF